MKDTELIPEVTAIRLLAGGGHGSERRLGGFAFAATARSARALLSVNTQRLRQQIAYGLGSRLNEPRRPSLDPGAASREASGSTGGLEVHNPAAR
jgi:hypothetical protein